MMTWSLMTTGASSVPRKTSPGLLRSESTESIMRTDSVVPSGMVTGEGGGGGVFVGCVLLVIVFAELFEPKPDDVCVVVSLAELTARCERVARGREARLL